MIHRRVLPLSIVAVSLAAAGCAGSGSGSSGFADNVTIVVNAPLQKLPFVGNFSLQGAQLAADEINGKGGVKVGSKTYGVKIERLDNDLSPTTSLDNVRKAAGEKAVAIIDDGYTVDATYKAAQAAGVPILIDYAGTTSLIAADERPNVFRIAPPSDAVAGRLTAYIASKHLGAVAILHDDSGYGTDGDESLRTAAKANADLQLGADIELPSTATGYSTQALQVVQSNAAAVVIWARSPVLAAALKALREGGFKGAVYASPTAEDPVVRTQLADHPEWVEGLAYASFRITTESGPAAWEKFRKSYEDRKLNNGSTDYKVGVKTSKHADVVQPPNWQIFPYDMVYLVKAALEKAGTVDPTGGKIVTALNGVEIKSANGDSRGFQKDNHEGVRDDDIYFAHFVDEEFKPVQDDPLSKELPPIDQE